MRACMINWYEPVTLKYVLRTFNMYAICLPYLMVSLISMAQYLCLKENIYNYKENTNSKMAKHNNNKCEDLLHSWRRHIWASVIHILILCVWFIYFSFCYKFKQVEAPVIQARTNKLHAGQAGKVWKLAQIDL